MFVCLHLPDFPIKAALATQPSLHDHPCAIVANPVLSVDSTAPLWAINRAARQHGLAAGIPAIRARLRCPNLRFLDRNPAAEHQLTEKLQDIAESLGPDFEITAPDTILIDLNGCAMPANWNPAIPELRLNFAETPDLARFATLAGLPFSTKPVQPVDLDKLPIFFLQHIAKPPTHQLLHLLEMWGIHTIGDLRRLSATDLAERAGPEALRIHEIIHGRYRRLLKRYRPREVFSEIVHFEHSIENAESVLFQLNGMLITLSKQIKSLHLAASSIRINLLIETNDLIEKHINLPEPRVNVECMLPFIHTVLEIMRVPAGITALGLELETVVPVAAQSEWLGRRLCQSARWPETLARLEGLLGDGRVGIPLPRSGHRPDDFEVLPLSGAPNVTSEREPDSGFPLRRFRPPLEVVVATIGRGGIDNRPQALLTGPYPGRIRRSHGPFPVSGHWWDPQDTWRRLEWDIELESHHLLRLASLPPDRWLLEGSY